MATGLKVPVGVDSTGGTAMVSNEEENTQVISIALTDCDNDNAFQQNIGLGVTMVFDNNNSHVQAKILKKLREIFNQFQALNRFKFLEDSINWTKNAGELTLKFTYHDLESDELIPFAKTFIS